MIHKMAASIAEMPSETTRDDDYLISSRSSVNSNDITTSDEPVYKLYPRRWFMLIVIVILNLSNAMIWITFSPIASKTVPYYDIDPLRLNMFSLVFLIASVPFGFLASWLLDTLGLRASLIISAWLNGVGSLLRNISTINSVPHDARFSIVLTGQILAACAQPFVMFAPTKLAALWFPDSQRATANMMASMSNPLGILVANILAPAIVHKQSDIPILLWVITGPALLVLLMATFGVCSSVPPTPPTSSAAEESEPFFQGLKQIVKNKNYWILNFAFGAGLAVFTSLSSFLDQILCPRGYTDDFAGLCGALMIAVGALGAVIAGLYVDKTKKFQEVVKISLIFSVLSGIVFTQVSRLRDQQVLVALSVSLLGGFGFAIYPISMELAVEITYPIAEATSTGLAVVSGQLQGIVYMLLMQFIAQDLPAWEKALGTGCDTSNSESNGFTPQDWTVPDLFMNAISVFSMIVLVLFFRGDYKRLSAEQRAAAEGILHRTTEISANA